MNIFHRYSTDLLRLTCTAWAVALACAAVPPAHAADAGHAAEPAKSAPTAKHAASAAPTATAPASGASAPAKLVSIKTDIKDQLKAAIDKDKLEKAGKPPVARVVNTHGAKEEVVISGNTRKPPPAPHGKNQADADEQYQRARAIALTGHAPAPKAKPGAKPASKEHGADHGPAHWSYEGETGPQSWGRLQPDFLLCALGKRQSPINIVDSDTLQGPAEPLQFNYAPSNASVVNNGHTIQVDVSGNNTLTVRGSTYRLLQFHFHSPSEEQINHKQTAMVAHLVHRNDAGQLAVVAVLLEPGAANEVIHNVWTHMPLDANDRVRMPDGLLDLADLLPRDQRYYQFMGSLTTPPCSENVLWQVLRQPVSISPEQLRLFRKLYPNNARPVQPVNGRAVREAM